MGAQPAGQVPQTIGQIAFDDAFPGAQWDSSMISTSMTA